MEHVKAVGGWYMEDREIEITPRRVMKIIESTNDPRSEYFDLMRRESIPADELMGRRMEIGVVAVLGQLRAKRNWHRIIREWVYADPPATELGPAGVGRTSRKEGSSGHLGLPKRLRRPPNHRGGAQMSRIRRGWALTKKSWALLNETPRADPLPALRSRRDDAAGDRLPRPRALPARPGQRSAARSRCW